MKANLDKISQKQGHSWPIEQLQLVHTESTINPKSSLNCDDLIHELHGHKLELERQIEDLRQTKADLEISRNHYIELYEFAPVGYVSINSDGLIVEINLTGSKLLKVDRKQIMKKNFDQFIADGSLKHWHQHSAHAKLTRRKHICELPIRQADGNFFHAHLDCLYTEINETLHIIFTDITERKMTEEELRIAAVTFQMQEGIIVADARKVILRVNHAFSRITGYSAREAIGKSPSFLQSGMHDRDFYRNIWMEVARNGFWQGEIWNKRKDGELFPLLQTITAVVGADRAISHYVGAFTDITAQKQAEKVLLDARDCLEIQVVNTQEELEKIKQETAEINTALNVMLRHRETDKAEAQSAFSNEVDATVLPLIKKLKGVSNGRTQSNRLIGILESSLQRLVDTYGRGNNLSKAYLKLTPNETQVAAMIKQGLPTKTIAVTLNISAGTVEIHRKHIRKKLGLNGKDNNLRTHLLSLSE